MADEEKAKEAPNAPEVEFQFLDPDGQPVTAEGLREVSERLKVLLDSETLDFEAVRAARAMVVMPGDVFAKVKEAAPDTDPPYGETVHVAYKDGQYWARRYGYAALAGRELTILSPLWMSHLAVKVYWLLLHKEARPVTMEDLDPWLKDWKVTEGLQVSELQSLLKKVVEGEAEPGAHLVAAGIEPVRGADATVEILAETDPPQPRRREDGSLDFGETKLGPTVRAGQHIASRVPPTSGTSGRNVRGQVCPAGFGEERNLKAGKGVRVEAVEGVYRYLAEKDGVAKVSAGEISVREILVLEESIGYGTGNIKFEGDVCVRGSVGSNFSVKADGDVVITESVEPGATVTAQGSVTVGRGISGRKSRVLALGDIRARFVEEATVQSARAIVLECYARDAFLRATEVRVRQAGDKWGGSVFGGQVWGMREIDTCLAGNAFRAATQLNAGLSLEIAQRLEELDRKVEEGNKQLVCLLRRFNLERVDVKQIQNLLKASSGAQKTLLARSAHDLGVLLQAQQKLFADRQALRDRSEGRHPEPLIRVRNTAYPGVALRIGDHVKTIQAEIASPVFRIRDGRIVEG